MDNTSDKEQDLTKESSAPLECAPPAYATRRRFARNVVVGGAVLASLGNRAAWGQVGPAPGQCMSVAILHSFSTTPFASAPPDFDYTTANNIIAVRDDTMLPREYPRLRVQYTDNEVCIVGVQDAQADDSFIGPLNKSLRQIDLSQ